MPKTPLTPDTVTPLQKFTGLVVEVSPMALPAGAMVSQINMMCDERGVLQTRNGLKPVSFENE